MLDFAALLFKYTAHDFAASSMVYLQVQSLPSPPVMMTITFLPADFWEVKEYLRESTRAL